MNHKHTINREIGKGIILLISLVGVGWILLPDPELKTSAIWMRWCFLYSLPLSFGVLMLVLKRYQSDDLIRGCFSTNQGIEVERAYLQNTVEQTLITLPLALSYGTLAPAPFLKAIPLHALVFLIGRVLFFIGYKKSYDKRIVGFVITNYANVGLFVGCVFWFAVTL